MPNLRQFIVTVIYSSKVSRWWTNIFDGHQWQQLLTNNTFHLDIFRISLVIHRSDILDVDIALKSFGSFATLYDDWYVGINQRQSRFNSEGR
jgi:hypothetical protein